MIKIIKNPKLNQWSKLIERPTYSVETIEATVNDIFKDVQRHGDKALKKYTSLFDDAQVDNLQVSEEEIEKAVANVSSTLQNAIKKAKQNIFKFHAAQNIGSIEVTTMPGVKCWQEKRPIQSIGLYIPGGTAPLFSTVLMLAIPAKIAGVKNIMLCSPPNKDGQIADEVLYAANLCGINNIFKVGGIQAIAGLTFGTKTIPAVYKIFGPGNQYVTVAKQMATKFGIAIDMPAGPSELLVLADHTAKANFVAADLLSQAEHGTDSQVILVSTSIDFIERVKQELAYQIEVLPRKTIAENAINNSKFIYMDTNEAVLKFINAYAPEHLIICTDNNAFFIKNIMNAGSVFVGNFTPESAGDYASGTNHTLPTNGFSRSYSGVNLDSFLKSITFQEITKDGLQEIGDIIEVMAEAEGLQAHKNAVSIRLKELNTTKE